DVAGAHTLDARGRAFDVLGEDVATAHDDDVLLAATHHELPVDEIREVTGAEPTVVEGRGRRFRVPVVPGCDRRAAKLELADLALTQQRTRRGIDDAQL